MHRRKRDPDRPPPIALTRERGFRPNYLSFSGTYQCNLTCPHCCVPIEWPDHLPIPAAVRFLDQAAEFGINVIGFTGGEPFLYPEFVVDVSRRAAELGFRFDKIMTNGVWFDNEPRLESIMSALRNAGYSGKIGLSIDKFHGKHGEKLVTFCRAVRRIFDRDNILSLSYASPSPDRGLQPIRDLARHLDAVVEWSDLLHRYLLVSPDFTMTLNWNHLAAVERAENLPSNWDGEWFEEDYCEGPGQALIVTPRGEVKPCCGFASDLDQLTIGNIHHDTLGEIVERAENHPYVGKVFREGLLAIRDEILARDPNALPGATSNHCFFCWYVLTRGLAHGVNGGGGQVGNWIGTRPNAKGELLQVGLPRSDRQRDSWWQFMERARMELEASGSSFMNEKELTAHLERLGESDQFDDLLKAEEEDGTDDQ